MSNDNRELLSQFGVYRTEDPAEAQRIVHDRFGIEIVVPEADGFFARTNFVRLPNLRIFCSANTTPLSTIVPNSVVTHVHLLLRGHCIATSGEQRTEASEGDAVVCSAGRPARFDYTGCEEVVLLVPPAMLDRTFAALTGFPPKCAIEFEPMLDTGDPRYHGFHELVMMLAGLLDPAFSVWPQATLEQLETACVTSLLFCGRHNLSHLLDSTPYAKDLPRHLRIAEHFAEVNADSDMAIDEMARAAAVSVSTLTRAFLKHRGCTPAAFIKRTRLARARDLLERREATTVTGVALRCGFSNPSRFGRDYQQAFGETPTQTLRRLRGQPLEA